MTPTSEELKAITRIQSDRFGENIMRAIRYLAQAELSRRESEPAKQVRREQSTGQQHL